MFYIHFHDQANPFKYISQFSGVNYTGNKHYSHLLTTGTAYNLIGSKNVSNNSILNCLNL